MKFVYYLLWVAVCSLVAFGVYGYDKLMAKNDGWRIPEKTLHGVSLAGGWPGAWLGSRYFRHKTQKTSFIVVYWLTVLLHFVAAYFVLF